MSRLAIVAIGRNEGERLGRCLDTILGLGLPVVYVDSGSTDGSPELGRRRGASVVELDPARPFSAARARNEGLDCALAMTPGIEVVQFVDGDCELVPGWIEAGLALLDAHPRAAAVCGRVRERNRERSIYNRLCDLEWQGPAGETRSCGGNAMMRVAAFREAGGFLPALIAGEEPELCLRLRRRGWKILRSDVEMVRHDAEMTSFGQWWRRALRSGWGYAEGVAMHGSSAERYCVRDARSIVFWGAVLPAAMLLLALPSHGGSVVLLAGYPALFLRIRTRSVRAGMSGRDASLQALFFVLAKFPQMLGIAQFVGVRTLGRKRRVVDWRVAG